jgi:gluconate 2-dehydrogenase gamma chain
MSNLSKDDFSRRDLLRNLSLTAATVGLTVAQAQHIHEAAAEQKKAAGGAYKPNAFTAHEYATLSRLCDVIFPGAIEGGAPEYIDLLASHNPDLQSIYTGGIAWLDHQMQVRYTAAFIEAKPEQQTAMLDLIAYRKNSTPEIAPGIRFFDWARRMTSDAYYTSAVGMKDIGFMGNKAVAKFEVPVEAVQYALKRSGL